MGALYLCEAKAIKAHAQKSYIKGYESEYSETWS
jgi:hypothetical protein